jgi:hypothetical protein
MWIIQWILRLTLVNSRHEKYDFDLCKGFSMGKKMTQILQILKIFIFVKAVDFFDKFQ